MLTAKQLIRPARCAVCGGTSDVVVWQENGYEGRSCACGTVYTTPEPCPGAVDLAKDGHPESFYSLPARLKVRWVQESIPSGRLLEVGSGGGHFLAAAQAAGYEVAGIEPDPDRAQRVAERLRVNIICARLEDLNYSGERFDIVYHCNLLSHFPDPVAALRKMQALLSPSGILAFEVGILAGISPLWYGLIGSLGYPQHRWFYSEGSLRGLLRKAGLRIERITHFGLLPAVLMYRSRSLLLRRVRGLIAVRRTRPENSNAQDPVPNSRRSGFLWLNARVDNFFRYRVGRLAPRVGPGTLFVTARPDLGSTDI